MYHYDDAGHVLGIYDGSGALAEEIVWLGDIPLATLRPKAGGGVDVYYIHTDHLNTPRLITDASNNARWRWDAEPFGGEAPNDNPSGVGAFAFNLRLPGQMYVAETGLYYNYFRDYDPATGRYVESDPIGLHGGINTYGYALNNPLAKYDKLGLCPMCLIWPRFAPPPGFTPDTREHNDLTESGQRAWNDFVDRMSDFFDNVMNSSLTDEAERAGEDAAGEFGGDDPAPV